MVNETVFTPPFQFVLPTLISQLLLVFLFLRSVLGRSRDFGNSRGLMGNYQTSKMLGRDGKTVIQDSDMFGSEWQVQENEAELFRTLREPQHPHAACNMPDTIKNSRHLRQESDALFVTAAEQACASKSMPDFEFCVHDVLATKDIDMHEAW